ETRLPPGEVLARARAFFQDRVGLQLSDESQRHIRFSGGGGWVLVTARSTFHGTDLTVEVGEFDREAEDFLASLPLPAGRLRRWWGIWRRGR
ncbi:MAG: hypothetical protein QJR03_08130, partial [Sphaerobacter sp.]|nr:hypothetical protein [Sphaerobacter sp.]